MDIVVVDGRQVGVGLVIDAHAFLIRSNYVPIDLGLAIINPTSNIAVPNFVAIEHSNKVGVIDVHPSGPGA